MTPGPFDSKCSTRSYPGICQHAAGEADRATGHVWTPVLRGLLSRSRTELWVRCFSLKRGLCAHACICVLLLACKSSKCACPGGYSFTNCLLAPGIVKSEHSLSWTVLTWSLFLWSHSHEEAISINYCLFIICFSKEIVITREHGLIVCIFMS